jgi:hypothetical protein
MYLCKSVNGILHDVNGYMVVILGVACITLEFFGSMRFVIASLIRHDCILFIEDKN